MFLMYIALGLLIIIGVPIGSAFLINYILKKKNVDKRLRIVSITPILVLCYFVFTAFYPNEDFYREDFKEITNIDLPKNVEFLDESIVDILSENHKPYRRQYFDADAYKSLKGSFLKLL